MSGSSGFTVFTIGHSDRPIGAFTELLVSNGVRLVADVRKLAGSNAQPQFNADVLASSLAPAGIRYQHVAELGGRRPVSTVVPFEVNALWRNRSFHNYADHALGEEFHAGLELLLDRRRDGPIAIMCSEAVWWRCHRRIIADHLLARSIPVAHLLAARRNEPARLTDGAVVRPDLRVVYPATTS